MVLSLVSKVMVIMQRVSEKAPIMQVVKLDDDVEYIARTRANDHARMDPYAPVP